MQSELAKNIDDLINDLKSIDITILHGRLERGNILQRIKDSRAYIGYDSYCSTFHEFLEAIHLNRETARQDMEIYKEFSYYLLGQTRESLRKTSYERLIRLLPIVRKEPKLKLELLEMSVRSNRSDFDNNVRELKGLTATDSCENCMEEVVVLHKCKCCGLIEKVGSTGNDPGTSRLAGNDPGNRADLGSNRQELGSIRIKMGLINDN